MGKTDIALTRFGLGARPGERVAVAKDPESWLKDQTKPRSADMPASKGVLFSAEGFRKIRMARQDLRRAADGGDAKKAGDFLKTLRPYYAADVKAKVEHAVTTTASFRERMVLFWSNHFTVSAAGKPHLIGVIGTLEREAIRPNVMGKFEDMLLAVARHPVMLAYLDNIQSVGPNSRGGRFKDVGLNENYARETLELHTLGVNGGYAQDDVIALAKILTGWSVDRTSGAFTFRKAAHEPGAKTLLGERYSKAGVSQGESALKGLARHPSTARHIAEKLARHMRADAPPDTLVERLERTFIKTNGDLGALSRTLIDSPEMWEADQAKFKTPNEFIVSALRALNAGGPDSPVPDRLALSFDLMAQRPFFAPSPAGWPDGAADWAGPSAVKQRLEWSQQIAAMAGGKANPAQLGEAVLGDLLGETTRFHVAGAESGAQGLTLMLMAPEFQRR